MAADVGLVAFTFYPDAIVAPGEVTCDMTLLPPVDGTITHAICKFKSPNLRAADCVTDESVENVWSCPVAFNQYVEKGTWTVDYVFWQYWQYGELIKMFLRTEALAEMGYDLEIEVK